MFLYCVDGDELGKTGFESYVYKRVDAYEKYQAPFEGLGGGGLLRVVLRFTRSNIVRVEAI